MRSKSADLGHRRRRRRTFALEFSALLDGLSIQVALEDPEVDSAVAYDIAMRFAERELNLPAEKTSSVKKRLSTPKSSRDRVGDDRRRTAGAGRAPRRACRRSSPAPPAGG